MCLVLTCLAAVLASILWYFKDAKNTYKLGTLALVYWGACLMWLVDCVFAFMEGKAFLDLSLDDTLLGGLIALCGIGLWLVLLIFSNTKKLLNLNKI